ncbi:hypothetical protein ACN68I_01960 [Aerococcus viridans]
MLKTGSKLLFFVKKPATTPFPQKVQKTAKFWENVVKSGEMW